MGDGAALHTQKRRTLGVSTQSTKDGKVTGKMVDEAATGHYLEKRVGGGDSRSSFGGSLFLVDAKLKNEHMHTADRGYETLGRERDSRLRFYIRARNNLRDELNQLEKEKRTLSYLDGDLRAIRQQVLEGTWRAKAADSRHYNRQPTSLYTPSFLQAAPMRGSSSVNDLSLTSRDTTRQKIKLRTETVRKPHGDLHRPSQNAQQNDTMRTKLSGLNLSPRCPAKATTRTEHPAGLKTASQQRCLNRRLSHGSRPRSESLSHVEDYLKISKVSQNTNGTTGS